MVFSYEKRLTMTEPHCLTITEPQFEQPQHRSAPLGLRVKPRLAWVFRRYQKIDFLNRLPPKSEDDYRQTKPDLADHYVIADRRRFPDSVLAFGKKFDAVISSHNLEHCDNRDETLDAMTKVVKDGGRLYISLPSEMSVTFPSREGCLNYYDDPTHQSVPPDFGAIIDFLSRKGFSILYSVKRYQPPLFWTLGFVSEPYPNGWVACKVLGNTTDLNLSSRSRKAMLINTSTFTGVY
jgi:SAM-dependent methyltransferase